MTLRTTSPLPASLMLASLTMTACGGGAPAGAEPAAASDPGAAEETAGEGAGDAGGDEPGTTSARICKAAPDYRYEHIDLPPEFAPAMPAGYEELYFAPGMFDPEAAGYFSYVFGLVLDDEAPNGADELEELLDVYYRGLIGAVGESRGESYDLSRVKARVEAAAGQPGAYAAAITAFDAFTDGRELDLRVELRASGHCLHAAVSPQPPDHAIWDELATASECLPCSR